MIKDIFLPEKIGMYYIFPTRILGFDISKTHINITQLYVHGKKRTLEKFIEEKIEPGNTSNYTERAAQTIKRAMMQTAPYSSIHTALNSSVVVFKELKLPFLQYEKIKMVINFEVEPLLPFPSANAVIDFIITKQNLEEKSSEVLVAAVLKEHIDQHRTLFTEAGINPNIITVDLFALYSLYMSIPAYAQQEGDIALIDLGIHSTRIAYIHNTQLRFIRTIPKGTFNQAKNVSETLKIQPAAAMEQIIRFGLEDHADQNYTQAITKAATSFWQEINFTLQSFSGKTEYQTITQILLLGGGSELKGLSNFVYNLLGIPCELFTPTGLLNNNNVTLKNNTGITSSSIISLSAAFPSPIIDKFNLNQYETTTTDTTLFTKQLLTAILLTLLLFATMLFFSFFKIRKLREELNSSKKETMDALKEQFPKIEGNNLDDVIDQAQQAIDEEERMWFAFSGPARASFLKYLLELTNRIDKESLGLTVEKIVITGNTLTLKARVKDYEALKTLERDLRQSKLFSYIEPQEKTDFTMQIGLIQNTEGIQ